MCLLVTEFDRPEVTRIGVLMADRTLKFNYYIPRATLGTRRVRKRYHNGTINICKSRLEVHLANTF